MSVNESKARRSNFPQWEKWRSSGAKGDMNRAIIEGMRADTVPAQISEEPLDRRHIALTTVGQLSGPGFEVSTIAMDSEFNGAFETVVFKLPRSANVHLRSVDSTLLEPYSEVRVDTRPAALRHHARAVDAASLVLGTPRS